MGEDWGKLIVAKGIKKFPKDQNIAQSGHTALLQPFTSFLIFRSCMSYPRQSTDNTIPLSRSKKQPIAQCLYQDQRIIGLQMKVLNKSKVYYYRGQTRLKQ